MKRLAYLPVILAVSAAALLPARAEYLFNDFVTPSFAGGANTEYSAWDVFYTPYGNPNMPDFAAPFGSYQTASQAGFTPPANSSPSNPLAFWSTQNPTITQTGTNTAFIIGPDTTGNIYSFSAPLSYALADTTPYKLGTVLLQFQTDGSLTDFSSLKLQYTNTSGQLVSLSPVETLREYEVSGSPFGGVTNRAALQWNLAGLNITSYQIVWSTVSASNSLQLVSLDTAATAAAAIPATRSWSASSGNWSNGANWTEGTTSNENGNVNFVNATAATVTLDGNHAAGQITFTTPGNVTINSPGGFTLTANTGITTTAQATGTYTVNSAFKLGAFNLCSIGAGTVQMNGAISGSNGIEKDGAGTLILAGNNTFTGSLSVNGGTLRLTGTNSTAGLITDLFGTLVVAADGALGPGASAITVGADSGTFAVVGGGSAQLLIDGQHTLSRNITLANGSFDKTLGAVNAPGGATFSGTVSLAAASAVHLNAAAASDVLNFRGGISGGATGTVAIDGLGTVSLGGASKTYNYLNTTNVTSGTLRVESGATLSGGDVAVGAQGKLLVSGSLSGTGTLNLNGGLLGGSGTVSRQFTVDGGDILSPGGGLGTLNTGNEFWGSGGRLRFEIGNVTAGPGTGWDLVNITGALSLTATSASKFTLELDSLSELGGAGLLGWFDSHMDYSWEIVATTGGITGFDPSEFSFATSTFQNSFGGSFNVSLSSDGKDLMLNYSSVPEPSASLLALVAGGWLLGRRRRRAPIS